jgi:hypothetical protein
VAVCAGAARRRCRRHARQLGAHRGKRVQLGARDAQSASRARRGLDVAARDADGETGAEHHRRRDGLHPDRRGLAPRHRSPAALLDRAVPDSAVPPGTGAVNGGYGSDIRQRQRASELSVCGGDHAGARRGCRAARTRERNRNRHVRCDGHNCRAVVAR